MGLSRGLQVTCRRGKDDLSHSEEKCPHRCTQATPPCILYLVFSPFYLIQLSPAPLLQPRSSAAVKLNHLFPDVVVFNALCYSLRLNLVGKKTQNQAVDTTTSQVNSTLEIPSPTPLPMAGQRRESWSFQVVKGPK